jgi:superfamily II DNA or RNA helicase
MTPTPPSRVVAVGRWTRGETMRVLAIAPPGAGKGTQGALIAAHFETPTLRRAISSATT